MVATAARRARECEVRCFGLAAFVRAGRVIDESPLSVEVPLLEELELVSITPPAD